MIESSITAYVNISFIFFKSAYYVSFLSDADLFGSFFSLVLHWVIEIYVCFSLILVRKANAVDRKFWGHFLLLEQ
jgi:hypothetical protein